MQKPSIAAVRFGSPFRIVHVSESNSGVTSKKMGDSRGLTENKPVLIATLLLIDSLHFVFARMLLPHIRPEFSAMYVMAVGTVQVGLFAFLRKRLSLAVVFRNFWFFTAIGLLVALSTIINYEAVALIDPGTASMLRMTSILFGIGFGLFWLKERLSRCQVVGSLVALCGVFTITFQPSVSLRIGSVLILLSAFMYALHAAMTKRFGEKMDFIDFFFYRLLFTTGILFLMALGRKTFVFPDRTAWMLLLLVGTLDITISRALYYLALRFLKISIHAIILTLSPVVAVLWSLALFDVLPNPQQLAGGAAVIAGVLLVLLQPKG